MAGKDWRLLVVIGAIGWLSSNYILQHADYRGKYIEEIRKAHGEFLESASEVALRFGDLEKARAERDQPKLQSSRESLDAAYRKMNAVYWGRFVLFGNRKVEKCIRKIRDTARDYYDGTATLGGDGRVSDSIIEILIKAGSGMREYYENEQSNRLNPLYGYISDRSYCDFN